MNENSPRILVVDDEETICAAIKALLTYKNYTVFTAPDSKTALDIIKERRPHLLLLDICLEKESGIDLLKTVRGFNNEIGVIMFSASMPDSIMEQAFAELKVKRFVPKPVNIPDLLEIIKEGFNG